MLKASLSLAGLLGIFMLPASGALVTNWVTTNGDAGFSGGSEATNSPVTTDSDAETIVGSFPEVTLTVGQTLTLTGSITITGNFGEIPGNQIRWALFDAPGTPTTGDGAGYVGVWATTANLAPGAIRSADGSTGNPFSTSASTLIVEEAGTGIMAYALAYDFSLSVTRVDDSQISVTGFLAESGDGTLINTWPETTTAASPANFTYDCVGILLGGTTDATQATLTDVEVVGTGTADVDLAITAITGTPDGGDLTLTWVSTPGATYAVDTSTDLESWPVEIDDSIPAATEGTLTSLTIPAGAVTGNERLFFRVREVSP